MDTPAVPAPRDSRELAILARLSVIRDQLLLLKQDRTTYIRSQDVIPLYDQTIEQVKELNDARAETSTHEENRRKFRHACFCRLVVVVVVVAATNVLSQSVDKVLESCFQLLSLFYLTIGRNNEAPAAYSLTSTIKRLLDHLTEAALYSAKDLESIKSTLRETAYAISQAQKTEESQAKHSPYLLTLLAKRVALCQSMLDNLRKRLEGIGSPLLPIHERLISILRQISLANTKSKVSAPAWFAESLEF
jgi:hypothetical protein